MRERVQISTIITWLPGGMYKQPAVGESFSQGLGPTCSGARVCGPPVALLVASGCNAGGAPQQTTHREVVPRSAERRPASGHRFTLRSGSPGLLPSPSYSSLPPLTRPSRRGFQVRASQSSIANPALDQDTPPCPAY
ncbi:hypothetical protein VUR80DRAFT_8846 [Thermomyces stellatus]